ncbi:MAG: LLM class flavin-dependent oxidoreductase [Novosphingobium sp.]
MNITGKRPKVIIAMSELFTMIPPQDERLHLEMARIAEAEGIHGLFVSEHVVMGPSAGGQGHPFNPRDFVNPGMQDPAMSWPSPLIKLAALGAVTETIRIMACALIAPLRHPIPLAKDLVTLDLLTNGRLTVLPTVSWHDEEYEALQIPFTERGKRLDEHLEIWHKLWTELPASHQGQFYQFHDTYFSPQPKPGSIKLWFGGEMRAPFLRRVAKYGDGMMLGWPLDAEKRALLNEAMAAAGRDADDLEVTGWLLPEFDTPDRPADIDRMLDQQIPTLVSQWCDIVAIKPSCFIDDPAEFGAFCRNVMRRIETFGLAPA